MKFAVTSEQKWILIVLALAMLAALPARFLARQSMGSMTVVGDGKAVAAKGDAVPILETDWRPRSMSNDEKGAMRETMKIDLNHIDKQALVDAHLPGVGDATAERIIEYRDAKGCFRSIEEIQEVKGFGESRFASIKDHVRVDLAGCVFKDGGGAEPARTSARSSKKGSSASSGGLININTASLKELDSLPGIGKTTAQRIIEYRDENGPFSSVEDLKNVKGIKGGTIDKIRDMVTTN